VLAPKKETVKLSSDGFTPKNQMKTIFLPYFLLVLPLVCLLLVSLLACTHFIRPDAPEVTELAKKIFENLFGVQTA
jgi:hypothetical protein